MYEEAAAEAEPTEDYAPEDEQTAPEEEQPEPEQADGEPEDGEGEPEGEEEEAPKDQSKNQWAAMRRKQKKARAQLESERSEVTQRAAELETREQQYVAELREFKRLTSDPAALCRTFNIDPMTLINGLVDGEGNLIDVGGQAQEPPVSREVQELRAEIEAIKQQGAAAKAAQDREQFIATTDPSKYPYLADTLTHGSPRAKQRALNHAYELVREYGERRVTHSPDDLRKILESELEAEHNARHTRLNKTRPAQAGGGQGRQSTERRRPTIDETESTSNSRAPEDLAMLPLAERLARAQRRARQRSD